MLKHPARDDDALDPTRIDDRAPAGRIRCPRCGWSPGRADLWSCDCGHVWNTFDTRGRCPGCGQRWRRTQCLSCHAWSAHDDWYP